MELGSSAPVLSTPAEHILEESIPAADPSDQARLSDDELYVRYEIPRTIREIRDGRRRRIALQFPDHMLVDSTRVFELLRDGMKTDRKAQSIVLAEPEHEPLDESKPEHNEERLCILGDTSYGACCVDEVAAEHVDADVVVHYGRACLSPTARLPVIYVFTTKSLDLDAAVASFKETYPDRAEKVCLMGDIPYTCHTPHLHERLQAECYTNTFATQVIHDPSSLLPNRTIPSEARADPEALKHYSIFHISSPPTSLLLILSSRIKALHIYPTSNRSPTTTSLIASTTTSLLRRRYALVTHLSTCPIFGILINTLSISNYLSALTHIQNLIRAAGKKSYTFVVGKVNAAKLANFAEIGGWVVIGCWESSLIESAEFYRPVITPFELELALQGDDRRLWDGRWVGDFGQLLKAEEGDGHDGKDGRDIQTNGHGADADARETEADVAPDDGAGWADEPSDDEPPEFDLRTGQYVSRSRPGKSFKPTKPLAHTAPASSSLVQRPKADLATINGAVSPAAEFLRSQRTWQGLGSDYEVAYERDEGGKIRGAAMEEGRSGVARGYVVGEGGEEKT